MFAEKLSIALGLALVTSITPVAAQHAHHAATTSTTEAAATKELPTQAFRDEHKEVLEHMNHVKTWAGNLVGQPAEEQKKTAQKIVAFFQDHIKPHAEWEEQNLYPIIDRITDSGKNRFTSTMRHEHRIVERWIAELSEESKKASPDYVAFARRTDNLIGLLWAHFEEEDEVLLPYVDKTMTREQFEKELGESSH